MRRSNRAQRLLPGRHRLSYVTLVAAFASAVVVSCGESRDDTERSLVDGETAVGEAGPTGEDALSLSPRDVLPNLGGGTWILVNEQRFEFLDVGVAVQRYVLDDLMEPSPVGFAMRTPTSLAPIRTINDLREFVAYIKTAEHAAAYSTLIHSTLVAPGELIDKGEWEQTDVAAQVGFLDVQEGPRPGWWTVVRPLYLYSDRDAEHRIVAVEEEISSDGEYVLTNSRVVLSGWRAGALGPPGE